MVIRLRVYRSSALHCCLYHPISLIIVIYIVSRIWTCLSDRIKWREMLSTDGVIIKWRQKLVIWHYTPPSVRTTGAICGKDQYNVSPLWCRDNVIQTLHGINLISPLWCRDNVIEILLGIKPYRENPYWNLALTRFSRQNCIPHNCDWLCSPTWIVVLLEYDIIRLFIIHCVT